jgi:hypothetical protein
VSRWLAKKPHGFLGTSPQQNEIPAITPKRIAIAIAASFRAAIAKPVTPAVVARRRLGLSVSSIAKS